ncbi:hypothetical protein GCM10011506_36960 [Marivirga lumbricoides]|uniref:DUF5362 domain-containing protein n=1 Tax=Marivirga lumbricoides TaxID=1046115 RepID=A0ABQ1MVT1_9BACT|nr:hypothetical protein GCM10011506_36960 [Marivirga lumbricoides]
MDENFSTTENYNSGRPQLSVSDVALVYLKETSKWTKFLAIMGFIVAALTVVFGFFSSSIMPLIYQQQFEVGMMPSAFSFVFAFIYITIGVLYFFPSLYLYKFSEKSKGAIQRQDSEALTEAFKNQKSLYKFWGIFTIIILGLYALMFIFGVLGAMMF